MESSRAARTTRLLSSLVQGDREVADEVLGLVYDELYEIAGRLMWHQRAQHTLQPTALVNEAWVRLVDSDLQEFESRKQFYALAAKAMRSVLVDHARLLAAEKRGGDRRRITLCDEAGSDPALDVDVLALHEALERLGDRDPALARIVELRFFGGLTHTEASELLGVPLRTLEYHWRLARAFLYRELSR